MDAEDRILFEQRMREIAQQTAQAYGAQAEVGWMAGPPATYNDAGMVKESMKAAQKQGLRVVPEESSLGGDDFAFFEQKIPGCYIKIGTGKGPTIHQPEFQIDEQVILPTAKYLAALFCE